MTRIRAIAFNPDGKIMLSAGYDQVLKLWDMETGRLKQTLEGHASGVASAVISRDGNRIASAGSDGSLKCWSVGAAKLLAIFQLLPPVEEGEASVDWIAFTPDWYYQSSAGAKKWIRWRSGGELSTAEKHESSFARPEMLAKALEVN